MGETELERLVVRLTGDMSSYIDALKKAQESTAQAAAKVESDAKRMEESLKSLQEVAVGAFAALGASKFMKEALHSFEESEKAAIQLEAALRANGLEVHKLSKDYDEFASEMERVTTFSDEAVKNLTRIAVQMGLSGEAAKEATKESMALGAAAGVSAETAMRLVSAMQKGDMERAMLFSRSIMPLRGVRNELEFTEKYQALVSAGMEVLNKEADTAGGRMAQLANQWDNFKEGLGETVSDGIKPVIASLTEVAVFLKETDQSTKRSVVSIIAFTAALVAADRAGKSFLITMKGMALNPLTWIAAAAAGIVIYANSTVEASEATRKLKEAMDDLEKSRRKGSTEVASGTSKFLEGEPSRRAIEERIKDNQDALNRLEDQRKKAQADFDEATRAGNPLSWLGKKGFELFGKEFGVMEKEKLKDVLAAIEALREANNKLTEAAKPKGVEPFGASAIRLAPALVAAMHEGKKAMEEMREKTKDFVAESKKITEDAKTPQEKAVEMRVKLLQMLLSRLITQETYTRALKDLENQLHKAADAQHRLNVETQSFLYGTAGAGEQIAKYLALMNQIGRNDRSRIPDNMAKGMGGGDAQPGYAKGPGAFATQGFAKGGAKSGRDATEILEDILAQLRDAGVLGVAGGN